MVEPSQREKSHDRDRDKGRKLLARIDASIDNATEKITQELRALRESLNASGKHHRGAGNPTKIAEEKDNAGQRQIPLSPNGDPSPTSGKQFQEPWYKTLHGWKSRLELAAIFGGFFYAWITYLQWNDTHKNFRVDQRAWIWFDLQKFDKEAANQKTPDTLEIHVPMSICNVGKTPALEVGVNSFAEILPSNQSTDFAFPANELYSSTTGMIFQNTCTVVDFGSRLAVTDEQRQALRTGEKYAVFYGSIQYSDAFGKRHIDQQCWYTAFRVGAGVAARPCTEYNRTDNN